jgi:hypothetical protein
LDLYGKLNCDVLNQGRVLLNGVNVQIKMVRLKDSFSLMAPANSEFKVLILDAVLYIRRIKLAPPLSLEIEKTLMNTTAKYPITRSSVKVFSLSQGEQTSTINNVFLGQLPKRLVLGLVADSAYSGSYPANGLEFKHYSLEQLAIYRNGQSFPSRPLTPDFDDNQGLFIRSYHSIFSGSGIHYANAGNCIARDEYNKGYCLYAFDLTPDLSAGQGGSHVSLISHGDIRIELRFKTALPHTVCLVVYSEFDSLIEITRDREVLLNFGN